LNLRFYKKRRKYQPKKPDYAKNNRRDQTLMPKMWKIPQKPAKSAPPHSVLSTHRCRLKAGYGATPTEF